MLKFWGEVNIKSAPNSLLKDIKEILRIKVCFRIKVNHQKNNTNATDVTMRDPPSCPPNPPASNVGSARWPLAASRRIPPRRAGNPRIPLPRSVPGGTPVGGVTRCWGWLGGTRLGGYGYLVLLVKGGFLLGWFSKQQYLFFFMDGLDRF